MQRCGFPPKWVAWGLFFIIALAISVSDAAENQRLALVIGNGRYENSPLANPVNDASDIAQALTASGFAVTLKTDADQRTMERAIRDFGRRLRDGGVGLFYYAGHGLQIDGRNYLIPVGAVIEGASDVRYEAVDAGFVLGKMEDAGNGLNIIILDACRDNPFARSFRSSEKGLAKMDAPVGSILAYATAPGSVAADGAGRNGLYTSKLLKYLPRPGLKIEDLFKQVRREVLAESGSVQVPWESSSLAGDFYFTPAAAAAPVPAPASGVPAGPPAEGQARLAALEADRARLEAERARLEAEKELLVVQQRAEAEKLKLQLEMERLKVEKARLEARQLPAQTTAPDPGGSPQADKGPSLAPLAALRPEPAAADGAGPLKLALLAVSGSHNVSNWGDRAVASRIRKLADATADLLMDRKDVVLAFSCLPRSDFHKAGWVKRNVKIIKDELSGEVNRRLWYRPSTFADWEPDKDQAMALARRFGADLVLMYRFYLASQAETGTLQIYLLDVNRGQFQRSSLAAGDFHGSALRPILERMLQAVLQAAPPGGKPG